MAKNKAAQSLGRRGGKARASALSEEERKAIAQKAGAARWAGTTPEERIAATAKARRAAKRRRKK